MVIARYAWFKSIKPVQAQGNDAGGDSETPTVKPVKTDVITFEPSRWRYPGSEEQLLR